MYHNDLDHYTINIQRYRFADVPTPYGVLRLAVAYRSDVSDLEVCTQSKVLVTVPRHQLCITYYGIATKMRPCYHTQAFLDAEGASGPPLFQPAQIITDYAGVPPPSSSAPPQPSGLAHVSPSLLSTVFVRPYGMPTDLRST